MSEQETASYGAWKSPITSDLIIAETIGVGGTDFMGDHIYWQELRPKEDGRIVVVRRSSDGMTSDLTPQTIQCAHAGARIWRPCVHGK